MSGSLDNGSQAVKVKICGLMREQDVDNAVTAGADAVGFVFVARSPRNIGPEQAAKLIARVPAFVTTVALFLDAPEDYVEQIIGQIPFDVLQFHGRESADFCQQFGRRYIKAVSVLSPSDIGTAEAEFGGAAGLLLDSHRPGQPGGSGNTFDWNMVKPSGKPLILAGGLNPDNVADAVHRVRPWAVDVSSGVECSPGVKDSGKMRRFVAQAKSARRN